MAIHHKKQISIVYKTVRRKDQLWNNYKIFNKHKKLIALFKIALGRMPSVNNNILIRSDKTPVGEHVKRYNASTIDEVATIVDGENLESRDIVLH